MSWKNTARAVAPLVVSMIPGVGPVAATVIGAGIGALGGGGRRGAAQGALTAGAGAMARPMIGSMFGFGAAEGATEAATETAAPTVSPGMKMGMLGALAASKRSAPAEAAPDRHTPEGWNDPLPDVEFDRQYTGPTNAAPYYTYGEQPFSFFSNNYMRDAAPAEQQPSTAWARGGRARGALGGVPGGTSRYIEGLGDGRDDAIPAQLSDSEYVIDAETVALLGNGSPDAGADALDQMRTRIRKHKGGALSKGKFSPNAREPEAYL